MGPMNPSIHKLSGRYCPCCLSALWQVVSSGVEFCPNDPACDYEVQPEGAQSINQKQAKARQRSAKILEVSALHSRLRDALDEVFEMMPPLTLSQKERPFVLHVLRQYPKRPPKFVVEQFHDEKGWVEIPGCTFTTEELAVAELKRLEWGSQQCRDMQVVKVVVVVETVTREDRELVRVGLPPEPIPFRTGEGKAH